MGQSRQDEPLGRHPGNCRNAIGGRASFVACHQFEFVDKIDVLEYAAEGAVFLLNASGDPATVWDRLPREMQQQIMEKHIRFLVIDAYALANPAGMGAHAQWTTSLSVTAN
jgi:Pyruvate/2-oxoacid:ferredoxin oxidoreductase gamma subunit